VQSIQPSGTLRLTVNGVAAEVPREPDRSLLGVLRDELDVTGPKPGCGEGVCGACTVLIDRRPVRSCRVSASVADGSDVLTVEGLASGDELHPVQRAFLEEGAFQCGYCTPGMVLASRRLLEENQQPSDEEISLALAGNVCRCGCYVKIVDAVLAAAGGED
jgi:aerobic-type carbon monoxide dehydrogenase small subunit (CoxS/CutS family)